MKLLKAVMENYITLDSGIDKTKANKDLSRPDHQAIFQGIPDLFDSWINTHNPNNLKYAQKSSIGAGNKAQIPWICVYNLAITDSVQQGYYIGLLFSEDMQRVYLSLNQGVTHSTSSEIQLFVNKALDYLGTNGTEENLIYRKINLSASKKLGQGYELSAIKSYEYHLKNLPSENEFKKNFLDLLIDYEKLFSFANQSLESLNPLSELTYQEDIQKKPLGKLKDIDKGGLPVPKLKDQISRSYQRVSEHSKKALFNANYQCEINPNHRTFPTKYDHDYMEGHHLIPMSKQSTFDYSLDVPENIICLCPNCHRALHHGDADTIKPLIKKLLEQRSNKLIERKIEIKLNEIINIYVKNSLQNGLD